MIDIFSFFKKNREIKGEEKLMNSEGLCDICLSRVKNSTLYCLTTTQIIKSKDFWNYILEREPLGQCVRDMRFKKDIVATRNVVTYVHSIAESGTPWAVCPKCISMFNVDLGIAKKLAKKKILDPDYLPPNSGKAKYIMDKNEYDKILNWAILEAGAKAY